MSCQKSIVQINELAKRSVGKNQLSKKSVDKISVVKNSVGQKNESGKKVSYQKSNFLISVLEKSQLAKISCPKNHVSKK